MVNTRKANSTQYSSWQGVHKDWDNLRTAIKTFSYTLSEEEFTTLGCALSVAMFQAEKRHLEVEERGHSISDSEAQEMQNMVNVLASLTNQKKEQERS